ncbi:disease resistance protein RGA5-like [Panicum virgatum]|nr:disease resistance protein RGA5-like [Panicum virgatum]
MYDVAKACCSSDGDFVYEMKPLGPADSKMLFFQRLFGSKEKCCPAHLTRISNKILEKCDGLPLAIISISGLLASKAPTEDEWGRVLNSIGRGLAKNPDVKSMMQILSLSYFDLPRYLKTCLLYLSVFPEDSIIDKKRLVRRWIAEGFIQKEQGQTLHDLGERCFNELINRSLIQARARDIDMYGEVTACQVHDTILDFIVSKSEEENFVSVLGDGYQITHGPGSMVRRLSVHASSKEKASTMTRLNLSRVRSVTVFDYSVELPLWSKLSFLRVLDLHGCRQVKGDHLTDIGNLFQLKYLSLRKTEVCELPEQIWKLKCLEILDLKESKVTELPAGIAQLQGLVCLAVDKGVKLPDGAERMTALEDLDCVDIFKQSVNFPQEFRQLKNLRNAELFLSSDNCSVEGSHKEEYMNDIASSLCKLSHLLSLSIDVDPKSREDFSLDSGGDDAPTGLQRFEITSHFISKVPNWVRSLSNLRFLTLHVKEFEVDDIMALGLLPALVFLRLVAHKRFPGRRVTICGADGFHSLRHFDYGCAIPITFEAGAMPMIEKLTFMFSICKTALLVRNDEFLFPFGVRHLTSLDSVNYLLHWHRKEIDGWITEKMAQMAHMSCEQLKATIREMEAIEQMFTSEKRMEKAARAHITSPELTIRRTVQWRISNVSGNRLTSAILQPSPQIHKLRGIKAQVEEQIRNCLLQGNGYCQCRGLL